MLAYLGMGANLGQPGEAIDRAVELLEHPHTTVRREASRYRSLPMGPPDQPTYVNTVVEIETELDPVALLALAKSIEQQMGRQTGGPRWGPRPIDVDILLYGDREFDSPTLTIPHVGIGQRRFVLAPLAELVPDLCIPRLGETVRTLLDRLEDDPDGVWLDTGSVRRGSSPP